MYRLNKPAVMSCSSGHINVDPINNMCTNNSTTTGSMFRGPVLLLDDHDHYHDHGHGHDKTKVPDHLDHLMKSQIANHPSYPGLLSAYIQCQKVGAPSEKALLLEEIGVTTTTTTTTASCSDIGADPELDCFMESYCEVLQRFKEELTKPLNEATMFLTSIESQLSTLSQANFTKTFEHYDDQARGTAISDGDHDEEDMNNNMVTTMSSCTSYDQDHHHHQHQVMNNNNEKGVMTNGGCEGNGDHHEQLKEKLLRKYSGYLTMLKTEFLKKRKKVELPKTARSSLLRWWNAHSRWPYPTEEEKVKLSEETGLDQKQINNWFVNQRKRHWKPSEDIKSALVNDLSTK